MIAFRLVVIVLFLTTSYAFADETSKASKIKELAKIQGLNEIIEQQRLYGHEQIKLIADKLMKEAKAQFPGLRKPTVTELENSYQKFLDATKPSWGAEDAVNAWSVYYGLHVTEEELDEILAFYKSPAGQKSAEAAKIAMRQWTIFFIEKNNVTLERAMKSYVYELKSIIRTENLRRKYKR